jgi:ribulose-bisphosphate carboxylase large chain
MITTGNSLNLSGQRFTAIYSLNGDREEALANARLICLEQTVELHADLLPEGDIADQLPGHIEDFSRFGKDKYQAVISYAIETTGFELVQLLNVLYGNISMKAGIRLECVDLPPSLLQVFKGPRFGCAGLRNIFTAPRRPLLATALKPMGSSPAELAEMAYQFALGGIDIIKDDHGLADQSFAPFRDRAARCAEAVAKANRQTGYNCIYVPNITAPADRIFDYARYAKSAGAGGLLVAAGLIGFDTLRCLAEDEQLSLPLIAHPAFLSAYATHPDGGIAHAVLYGQLPRLAGTDAVIFPNYGGRFSFARPDCEQIIKACGLPMGRLAPVCPVPAGGMTIERLPEIIEAYGRDLILLVSGDLYRLSPDLCRNSRRFRDLAESFQVSNVK